MTGAAVLSYGMYFCLPRAMGARAMREVLRVSVWPLGASTSCVLLRGAERTIRTW